MTGRDILAFFQGRWFFGYTPLLVLAALALLGLLVFHGWIAGLFGLFMFGVGHCHGERTVVNYFNMNDAREMEAQELQEAEH